MVHARYERRQPVRAARFLTAGVCAVLLLSTHPRPVEAALSPVLAEDNTAGQFEYWPKKGGKSYEFGTPSGHNYRVTRGQFLPTYGGTVTVDNQQMPISPGGLQVIFTMDHIIANADDDNASINAYFGANGDMTGIVVSLSPSKGFILPGIVLKGGQLVAGAIAGSGKAGSTSAVDAVGKSADSLLDQMGKAVDPSGGSALFPAEISAVMQKVVRAVQAAAQGKRLQHDGFSIQGWEGNSCTQDVVGSVDGSRRSMDLTSRGKPFPNDEVRSLRIYNNIAAGTLIQVFDDSKGSHEKDDWAEIVVDNPQAFSGMGECVGSFQTNRQSQGIRVYYYKRTGNGNLDGKVSRIGVFPPGQWTSERGVKQ